MKTYSLYNTMILTVFYSMHTFRTKNNLPFVINTEFVHSKRTKLESKNVTQAFGSRTIVLLYEFPLAVAKLL